MMVGGDVSGHIFQMRCFYYHRRHAVWFPAPVKTMLDAAGVTYADRLHADVLQYGCPLLQI